MRVLDKSKYNITRCLRKVRRIYNLYISGCIGEERRMLGYQLPSETLFKDISLEWESTTRGHCVPTGEREGMFVMSSFTGTREDQHSDVAHLHLDRQVNPRPTGGYFEPPLVFLRYHLNQCRYHRQTCSTLSLYFFKRKIC